MTQHKLSGSSIRAGMFIEAIRSALDKVVWPWQIKLKLYIHDVTLALPCGAESQFDNRTVSLLTLRDSVEAKILSSPEPVPLSSIDSFILDRSFED